PSKKTSGLPTCPSAGDAASTSNTNSTRHRIGGPFAFRLAPDPAHPAAHGNADTRREDRAQGRDGHGAPEGEPRILVTIENIADLWVARLLHKSEFLRAEHPVARARRHQKIRERPLHRDQHDKKN